MLKLSRTIADLAGVERIGAAQSLKCSSTGGGGRSAPQYGRTTTRPGIIWAWRRTVWRSERIGKDDAPTFHARPLHNCHDAQPPLRADRTGLRRSQRSQSGSEAQQPAAWAAYRRNGRPSLSDRLPTAACSSSTSCPSSARRCWRSCASRWTINSARYDGAYPFDAITLAGLAERLNAVAE